MKKELTLVISGGCLVIVLQYSILPDKDVLKALSYDASNLQLI